MEYVTLNNNIKMPTVGIGVRYYERTDEQLTQFATWQPEYENE